MFSLYTPLKYFLQFSLQATNRLRVCSAPYGAKRFSQTNEESENKKQNSS